MTSGFRTPHIRALHRQRSRARCVRAGAHVCVPQRASPFEWGLASRRRRIAPVSDADQAICHSQTSAPSLLLPQYYGSPPQRCFRESRAARQKADRHSFFTRTPARPLTCVWPAINPRAVVCRSHATRVGTRRGSRERCESFPRTRCQVEHPLPQRPQTTDGCHARRKFFPSGQLSPKNFSTSRRACHAARVQSAQR